MQIKCRICEQQLKRQGNYYYCPTCRIEIPLEDLEDIGDDNSWVAQIEGAIDFELLLKRLPPIQQKVARLKTEGYTNKEIAKKIGKSERTIYNYLEKLQVLLKSD